MSRNPLERLTAVRMASPLDINVIRVQLVRDKTGLPTNPSCRSAEGALHHWCREYRLHGEWFDNSTGIPLLRFDQWANNELDHLG